MRCTSATPPTPSRKAFASSHHVVGPPSRVRTSIADVRHQPGRSSGGCAYDLLRCAYPRGPVQLHEGVARSSHRCDDLVVGVSGRPNSELAVRRTARPDPRLLDRRELLLQRRLRLPFSRSATCPIRGRSPRACSSSARWRRRSTAWTARLLGRPRELVRTRAASTDQASLTLEAHRLAAVARDRLVVGG